MSPEPSKSGHDSFLARDSQRLQALVEHAPVCVHEFAPNGTIIAINPAGLELLGVEQESQVLGQPLSSAVGEEEIDRIFGLLEKALQGETSHYTFHLLTKRGPVHCASWMSPLRNEHGEITRILGMTQDITESQGALRALLESEKRYRQMFEANLAIKLISDPANGRIVEANRAACEFYGYSHEEIVGLGLQDIKTLPRQDMMALAGKASRTKQLYFEFQHRLKSGEVRDVEVFSGPLHTPQGLRLFSIVHDVTDRKRTQLQLQDSERRFARAVAGTSDGIWEWHIVQGGIYWSPRFKDLLGYQVDEIHPKEGMLWSFMHPDDVETVKEATRRHLKHNELYDLRYRLRHRDGRYRMFRARGTVERDAAGEPVVMAGSLEDISEQVAAERARTERRKRIGRQHRAIQGLATDPELSSRAIDRAFARLTETACDVLAVGRASLMLVNEDGSRLVSRDLYVPAKKEHFRGVFHDLKAMPNYLAALESSRALAFEHPLEDERLQEFPKGFLQECSVKSMLDIPVRRAGQVVGVLRLSEIERARRWRDDEIQFGLDLVGFAVRLLVGAETNEAMRQKRELESQVLHAQKLESLGLMASGVAHDFNNLLVAILGNADLAREDLEDNSRAHGLVSSIEQAARRAADLCRQMLAYSGRGLLRVETIDMGELVAGMAKLMRASLGANLSLHYSPPDRPLLVEADATQVRQVIMNLIVNAAESMQDNGGVITLALEESEVHAQPSNGGLAVPSTGRYVELLVQDEGKGMDETILGRMYDPFFSTKFTGRGLGMAAVLGIMRGHGGGIEVMSTPGKGTAFRLQFPVSEYALAETLESPQPEDDGWQGSGHVLLVDDDETVRLLGREMLERLGFQVSVVSNGSDALNELATAPSEGVWRLVVLDLTMPGMSGMEVLAKIHDLQPGLPVLMSSGYAEEEVRQQLSREDMFAFLAKPYTLAELRSALRAVLSSS